MVSVRAGDEITKELITPKNKDVDIEDDDVSGSESEVDNEHYVKVGESRLRRGGVNLKKYKGEVVSRRDLASESEEEASEEDDIDEETSEEEASEEEVSEEAEEEEVEEAKASADESSDFLADVTDSDDLISDDDQTDASDASDASDDSNDSYKHQQIATLLEDEKKQIVKRLSSSAKADALKGYSILQQQKVFDKIMDARIKLQKALVASNELPLTKTTAENLPQTREALNRLLNKILVARSKLGQGSIDIKYKSKKRTFDEYAEESFRLDAAMTAYRQKILSKWSSKVQAASGSRTLNGGKFKMLNQNVATQLENTLQDMDRLVKRTHMNRRNVVPIGYTAPEDSVDRSYNPYIFDDDDFYRVLLNDMVDKKISDKQATTNAAIVTLSNTKLHKNYDRMATKGRKMKFTVQEPLQNFETPKATSYVWNDDQIDELFASLLGNRINLEEDEEQDQEEAAPDTEALKESTLKLFG